MKKLNKLDIAIIILFIIAFIAWLFCDMLKIIWTPLNYFGMSHWVPECLLIFCIGWDASDWLKHWYVDLICILVFFYPIIHYGMALKLAELIFGLGAGCLFSGVFLLGIWFGKHKPL